MSKHRVKRRRRPNRQMPGAATLDRLILRGMMVLLIVMPLMLGTTSVRPWPMLGSRIVILGLFILAIASQWRDKKEIPITTLWIAFAAAAGFALLQLAAFPQSLIALLSPRTDQLFSEMLSSLSVYGQGQWHALTLDASETWHGLGGIMALLLVYLIGATRLSRGDYLKRLVQTLAAAGFLVAMIGFTQKALGMTKIFGFIPFKTEVPFFFSSFVNPNNMAGFLGMCVPLQIGLALTTRQFSERLAYMIAVVVSATAIFLSLSKGGIIAFLVGQLIFGFLLWRRKNDRKILLWIQMAVVAVLILSAFLAMHEIADEFGVSFDGEHDGQQIRATVWKDTLHLIGKFPLTGIGIDAFKVVYPAFKTTLHDRIFIYPENIFLQIISEVGIVVGGMLILVMAVWFVQLFRRQHMKRLEMAAFSALGVVAIHNYVDFNLNTFAISVPFVLLLGVMTYRLAETSHVGFFSVRHLPRRMVLLFGLIATIIIGTGSVVYHNQRLEKDQYRLHAAANDTLLPESVFNATMTEIVARHPADFYLRLLASERYDPKRIATFPLKMLHIKKAEQLNPSDPLVDMVRARAYVGRGDRKRALAAYISSATKTMPQSPLDDLWAHMQGAGFDPKQIARTTGADDARQEQLVHFLLTHGEYDYARKLLTRLVDQNPNQSAHRLRLIGRIEIRERKIDEAKKIAEKLIEQFPSSHYGYYLRGEVENASGNFEEALDWYGKAERLAGRDLELWYSMAFTLLELNRLVDAEKLALRIHGLAWKHPSRKANAFALSGLIDEKKGLYTSARHQYERTLIYEPHNGAVLANIARTYAAQKDYKSALQYYREAKKNGQSGRWIEAAIKQAEEQLVKQLKEEGRREP